MGVIFLAGVHGVGKSFLGDKVSKLIEIEHLSASELIKETKKNTNWAKDKSIDYIDENQLALISALNQRLKQEKDILLDGHFVLKSSNGNINNISTNVFSNLHLNGVILLEEDSVVIANRLNVRDGEIVSLKSIKELAFQEKNHAINVCNSIEIPLIILSSANEATLLEAIQFLTRRAQ